MTGWWKTFHGEIRLLPYEPRAQSEHSWKPRPPEIMLHEWYNEKCATTLPVKQSCSKFLNLIMFLDQTKWYHEETIRQIQTVGHTEGQKTDCPGFVPRGNFWTSMKGEPKEPNNLSELRRQIRESREAEELELLEQNSRKEATQKKNSRNVHGILLSLC